MVKGVAFYKITKMSYAIVEELSVGECLDCAFYMVIIDEEEICRCGGDEGIMLGRCPFID